jgi:hypothetical protein
VLNVVVLAAAVTGGSHSIVLGPSFPTTVAAFDPDIPISGLANQSPVGDFPYIRHFTGLL